MRKVLTLALPVGLWFGLAAVATADEPQALIDRAIKAHGGAEKLNQKAGRSKNKGKIEIMGGLAFTQDVAFQLPNKFKESLDLTIDGRNVAVVTVYDGKGAWMTANGKPIPLPDGLENELKEATKMMEAAKLTGLKDKKYELSPLGEVKVEGKAAEGVKVTAKGQRDLNLYFDKKSGLVVKYERQAHDFMSNQDVNEERIILEFQDVDGAKVPKKILINRDGKKFMDIEVLEYKGLDSIDDSEFAKP